MPLPDFPAFEQFLSQTAVSQEELANGCCPLWSPERSTSAASSGLYLHYPTGELSLDSVLSIFGKELAANGCETSRAIALTVLALSAATRSSNDRAVNHAQACLAAVRTAKLRLAVVLPNDCSADYLVELGPVSLKRFDPKPFLYWAERGGSAFGIDLTKLSRNICLERRLLDVRILDYREIPGIDRAVEGLGLALINDVLLDNYYQEVARCHFESIPSQVREQLIVLEAGAFVSVDTDALTTSMFSTRVALFSWQSGGRVLTWALLGHQSVVHMNQVPPQFFEGASAWLDKCVGFRALDPNRPFDRGVRSYCRFLQKAQRQRMDWQFDESFLHFVVALDLVFGTQGRSSASLASRVATIVYRPINVPLPEAVKRLRSLYDKRSKYVHEGLSPTADDLDSVERVCLEVLWALLTVSASGHTDSIDDWLRELDLVHATIEAGRDPRDEDYELVGIRSPEAWEEPPNHVEPTPKLDWHELGA